jgi:hypothetical protein
MEGRLRAKQRRQLAQRVSQERQVLRGVPFGFAQALSSLWDDKIQECQALAD